MYQVKRHSTSHFVPLRGHQYHVREWGNPQSSLPPLVLAHGWMDVAASWQFMVESLSDAFFQSRRILAADWRGYGLTQGPATDSFWLPDYLGDLDALLLELCPEQSIDLVGHSMGGNVVCPLHRWTYSDQGKLLGATHFQQDPCLNLQNYPLQEWNGLLFEANGRDVLADLAGMGPRAEFDFTGFVLDRVELHQCNYNWKTFIEVYLEDYHVEPFHPGLGNFVTCDDLSWQFKKEFSVQTVGVANRLGKAGSPVYERWQQQLMQYRQGAVPEYGAIWLTYYPHIMVEWYPHVLTVSTLHPISPEKTLNMVEFYYPEEIVAFERDFVEAQKAAYMETCLEDDEIAERMDAGRKALMQRGDNEVGPYQSPMEDGMQHFHEWYRNKMSTSMNEASSD